MHSLHGSVFVIQLSEFIGQILSDNIQGCDKCSVALMIISGRFILHFIK